jgi:hypothetical protein
MADTPTGETVVPEPLKNDVQPPATPAMDKPAEDSEVEKLRKQLLQEQMEKNQLRNKLEAEEKAKAEAAAKELEEQNKYKDLWEQSQAKLTEIETAKEKEEREAALKAESDKLFAEYPEQVKVLAEEAGMSLSDTDEATVAAFKAKLDKVSGLVAQPKVTPNNPGNPATKTDMSQDDLRAIMRDPARFEKYVKENFKGIASLTRQVAE